MPGRRTASRGRRSSARRRATSGRSSRRNGARSLVAGLDSATSGSRSSSVARRFTNVELPRRSVVGSSASASLSARFSAAIAPVVALALPTRSARSSRRSAIAVTVREELTMKRVRASSSSRRLVDQPARAREQRVEVLRGLGGLLALAVELGLEALDDALQVRARLRVERVEELVEVDRGGRRGGRQRRVLGQRAARVRAGRERDVAVGDARQRRQPDDRLRALAQRRVGLLDADPDRRLVVGRQLDLVDRADRAPADLDVVALRPAGPRSRRSACTRARSRNGEQVDRQRRDERDAEQDQRSGPASRGYSMPSGPCEAPDRNWRTNWLSESKSSSAGPDSTIRPFHSTAMYSATRLADMMSCVITT